MTGHRSLEQIIENQVNSWSLGQSDRAPKKQWQPTITISRAYGARGAALARRLGQRTGFAVWDRELVHAIAKEAGGDERIMQSLDEHRRSMVDEAVRAFIVGFGNSNVHYFRSLMRVIRTVSHHGSAVIVGRGANYAIAKERALRVRVTAPLDWRVASLADRTDQTREETRSAVVARDAERADFVAYYFRQRIEDSENYDLVMNAERFTLDQMTDLTLKAYADLFGIRPVPNRSVLERV